MKETNLLLSYYGHVRHIYVLYHSIKYFACWQNKFSIVSITFNQFQNWLLLFLSAASNICMLIPMYTDFFWSISPISIPAVGSFEVYPSVWYGSDGVNTRSIHRSSKSGCGLWTALTHSLTHTRILCGQPLDNCYCLDTYFSFRNGPKTISAAIIVIISVAQPQRTSNSHTSYTRDDIIGDYMYCLCSILMLVVGCVIANNQQPHQHHHHHQRVYSIFVVCECFVCVECVCVCVMHVLF